MHIVIKNCLLACRVDSEEDLYRLWVEGYQGNATDSLGSHNGYAFSTFDRDNDEAPVSNTRLKFQLPCSPSPLSSQGLDTFIIQWIDSSSPLIF